MSKNKFEFDLSFIKAVEAIKDVASQEAKYLEEKESEDIESEAQYLEELQLKSITVRQTEAEHNRYVSENEIRLQLIHILLVVTIIWMIFILIIIIACGKKDLKLSDGVLITLITTSTTEVLGFFYIVLQYLFNKDKST